MDFDDRIRSYPLTIKCFKNGTLIQSFHHNSDGLSGPFCKANVACEFCLSLCLKGCHPPLLDSRSPLKASKVPPNLCEIPQFSHLLMFLVQILNIR